MNITLLQGRVGAVVVRNYWWAATAICVYFFAGFVLWGASKGAVLTSGLALVVAIAGLVANYRVHWKRRWPPVAIIMGHLLLAQAILAWQKAHLPLTDYSKTGILRRGISLFI